MDDKISYNMKCMLLTTVKMARCTSVGGMKNDSWRVPVDFLAPSDYKGVRKLAGDAQLHLWGSAGWCNCLNRCDFRLLR